MKREADVKELLISNAIHLISEGGFEKATTKELTHCGGDLPDFNMNEVYIYRIFGSKESLYESAFLMLDREMFGEFHREIREMGGVDGVTKEKLYAFFLRAWRFILGNEDKCRCYVRYYYSVYFKGRVRETHLMLRREFCEEMAPLFREDADVPSILHSVFTSFLDLGICVYNGELEDNEINRSHVFNVLYSIMRSYLKNPERVA